MARRTLTSNKRAFRKNPQTFLDKITEAPVKITINDGVNPEYTVTYNPVVGGITDTENVPPGTVFDVEKRTSFKEVPE